MALMQLPPRPVLAHSRSQRPALTFILALAGLLTFSALAGIPHDGFHPLALLACLLPLQLAALLWALGRMR